MAAKNGYVAGLDAGSHWTRCLIGLMENSHVRLLGAGEAPSGGWWKSRIADHQALVASLGAAVRAAEKSAGVSIGCAVAGMGGTTVEGLNNRGVYEMGRPREIRKEDMRYAVEQALRVSLPADRMVLQMAPQDFVVDGRAEYWDPRGQRGSRLESFVHLVTVSTQEHRSLVAAMHQVGLEAEETIFEPYAAAYAAVGQGERAEGVVVVDIGAHSTEVVIYYGEALLAAASLQICGDHFTKDVAQRLCVSYEDAERLKRECGCALVGQTADNSLVELPSAGGRPPREAPRFELNDALEARAGELFVRVRQEIVKAGMDQGPLNGVVLTGAAASMTGLCDMAERVLNCQARNGLPEGIEDWPEEFEDPAWTTAAGLMLYSARLRRQPGREPEDPSLWSRLFG
ncbi:MAG TPA: cell division protein FtsA [Bryobacteraceae bacterium]|nr:cell division protein FtsA [Bryobacteraceae bacterium]